MRVHGTPEGKVISCSAPYGKGGLGQHFAQVVEEARAAGSLTRYYTSAIRPGDQAVGVEVSRRLAKGLARYTPVRFRHDWASYIEGELFDRNVAALLERPLDSFTGFVGKALHSFERARALGATALELIAVNSHVDNVDRLHHQAHRVWGFERSWLNDAQQRKTRREYQLADRIYVHSEYTRQSFLEAGIPAQRLERMVLTPHPRFTPPPARPSDGCFRIVYVGSVTVMKGIPLLREALTRFKHPEVRLTLVGGCNSRAMRQYLDAWQAAEPRLHLTSGDPLRHLQEADVCVHPTYEDGFAYAPMEALACGVPVVVTADTGMKEYVVEGVNGYVIPTGDWAALLDRLEQVRTTPLARAGQDLLLHPLALHEAPPVLDRRGVDA